jgi:hypothetical protein
MDRRPVRNLGTPTSELRRDGGWRAAESTLVETWITCLYVIIA